MYIINCSDVDLDDNTKQNYYKILEIASACTLSCILGVLYQKCCGGSRIA